MPEFDEVRAIVPNIYDYEKELRTYCAPVLCPNFDNPILTEFGSGTFVIIDGHYGVLTAAHIAEIFIKKSLMIFHLPVGDTAVRPIKIEEIIQLPAVVGWRSIDLAFVRLASAEDVTSLGYKFYDLSSAKDEILSLFPGKIDGVQGCAFLATPAEGKKEISLPDKKIIEYPYAAFSLAGIKKGSYSSSPFYFSGPTVPQDLRELELRLDEFKVEITATSYGIPQSYKGTSGGGFWAAELCLEGDKYYYKKSKLIGVLVEQQNNVLHVRGGISIYRTFLTFCSVYLKGGDPVAALKMASQHK